MKLWSSDWSDVICCCACETWPRVEGVETIATRGLSRTIDASRNNVSGNSRRSVSRVPRSRRICSLDPTAGAIARPMSDTMRPPKKVASSHSPKPMRADVAAPLTTTDSSIPMASHSETYDEGHDDPQDEAQDLGRGRHDAEADEPERRDDPDDRDEDQADDREAGRELAVDDVIAVDRLGQQARQRPLGALTVDGVEREGEAEQRGDVGEEARDRRQREAVADLGREPEQVQEDRGCLAGSLGGIADRSGGEVQRDRGGQPQHGDEDEEAGRQQVIAELLRGDDHPAGPRDRPRPIRGDGAHAPTSAGTARAGPLVGAGRATARR